MENTTVSNVSPVQPLSSFANFFTRVQDAPWYHLFLTPAIEELETLPAGSKVLDIGTGPGKFIELAQNQLPLSYVGTDIDGAMLAQARQRPALTNVPFHKSEPDQPLPFEDATFDAICFCSVLFLLDDPYPLLDEALRILRPVGKIIVLTPTGHKTFKRSWKALLKLNFDICHWTFLLWRNATRLNARRWTQKNRLAKFVKKTDLGYSKRLVFEGLAAVEVIQK